MAIDMTMLANYVFPAIQTFVFSVFGIAVAGGLWYWLFIIKRRKKWIVSVWERKADGRLHLINKEKILEKKINRGKTTIYVMSFTKAEVMPPPWESTYRMRGREYCDYLRVEDDFIPITKEIKQDFVGLEEKKIFVNKVKESLKKIRFSKKEDTEKRYIYVPVNNTLAVTFDHKPIDYDVNMMRINAVDNLEQMFKDKQDFMQKYGQIIAYGMVACLLIVALYLSYDFAENVIGQSLNAADKVASPLAQLVEKLGGTAPPV